MKHAFRVTTLVGASMLALSGSAFAGVFSQSADPADVVVGGSATTVQFLYAGDGMSDNAQLDIQLSSVANLTITANAPLVGGSTCTVIGGNVLRIVPPDASASGSTLPAPATPYCSFNFTAAAGATVGLRTWTANLVECSGLGNPVTPCTFTQSAGSGINVTNAPPNVNLTFAPAPGGTVTFPAGVALTTQNASIGITGSGTVGSGSVTACGITGAGAASFGPPPAGTITVTGGGTGTIPLTCTLPNSGGAATATLTCTETDADTPAGAARSWTLSCPQGTPVPGPGFGASPAPNTPATAISCSGQAGSTVQRQIAITNNGNPGAGSALDFNCTGGGIVSIVSGGTATGLAVGASQTVTAACTVPADGVTATGTVTCTSNAPNGPFVFNYTSTGSTFPPAVPRPAVVPASSTWSQLALIALLAGLGLAFVGFRRGQ